MDIERRRLAWEVVRLRYWQHLVNEDLKEGKIPKVPVHVAIGNEAIAVAIALPPLPPAAVRTGCGRRFIRDGGGELRRQQ